VAAMTNLQEHGAGGMVAGRDPDRAGGLLPEFTQGLELGFDLLQPRTHGPEQALARLGRCNAAGGAGQEANAKPRFKAADGMAQR
jgi:hypothetical protein